MLFFHDHGYAGYNNNVTVCLSWFKWNSFIFLTTNWIKGSF